MTWGSALCSDEDPENGSPEMRGHGDDCVSTDAVVSGENRPRPDSTACPLFWDRHTDGTIRG